MNLEQLKQINFLFKGYNITNGKEAINNWQDPNNWIKLDQTQNLASFGGVLKNNYIVIDFDIDNDFKKNNEAITKYKNKIKKLLIEKSPNCVLVETDHGLHAYFKKPDNINKNITKYLTPIGLTPDIRTAQKSYLVLKRDNKPRTLIYKSDIIDYPPLWLMPLVNKNGAFYLGQQNEIINIQEGERHDKIRNLNCKNWQNGFKQDEIKLITGLINDYLLDEPMKDINNLLTEPKFNYEINKNEYIEPKEPTEPLYMSASSALDDLLNKLYNPTIKPECRKTGFNELDNIIGGIYNRLYIIGAISSLGKTTFILQLADQLAKAGNKILFFALEQTKEELIAKSLSRLTYNLDLPEQRLTTDDLTEPDKFKDLSIEKINGFHQATSEYKTYSDNINFIEGYKPDNKALSINDIIEQAEEYINEFATNKETGDIMPELKPIIFIDYLQILSPTDSRKSDKQKTDNEILALKNLSHKLKIPVICISSFNRDAYFYPVNVSSFKESGGLEYTADVLIGLEYEGLLEPEGDGDKGANKRFIDTMRDKEDRNIQFKILKNRQGKTNKFILHHNSKYHIFDNKITEHFKAKRKYEDKLIKNA